MANTPIIMGILNVTPDSFSDGGAYVSVDAAVSRALVMRDEGASIIDIGGESTRPGAQAVSADEECARVVPVIAALHERDPQLCISIDTSKASVAHAALEAGASIVNDVCAGRDPEMFGVVAQAGAQYIAMHMQGAPRTMQDAPVYDDVVREVCDFFEERVASIRQAGIVPESIMLDPGIGFGKTLEHNLELLAATERLAAIGYPVVIGVSRKSLIGQLCDEAAIDQRLEGSLALAAYTVARGARVLRVHDVAETRRFFQAWCAIA